MYPLPPNSQFHPHVIVAYILQYKCVSLVHEDGILKWMVMVVFTLLEESGYDCALI